MAKTVSNNYEKYSDQELYTLISDIMKKNTGGAWYVYTSEGKNLDPWYAYGTAQEKDLFHKMINSGIKVFLYSVDVLNPLDLKGDEAIKFIVFNMNMKKELEGV